MKKLTLKYDPEVFWNRYWLDHGVDGDRFLDLEMYPIRPTLRHVRPGQRILECGCGAGRVVRHLHGQGYDIVGVEYDHAICEKLRAVDSGLQVVCGDGTALPFSDNDFDVSLAFGMVGTLHRKTAASIAELKRVTRPGGRIVVSVMLSNLARTAQKAINFITANEKPHFYAWMDSRRGWANFFECFNLTVVESQPMVSRYNIFYWNPLLRSSQPTDLSMARLKDDEYKLNLTGETLWALHRHVMRRPFAAAETFVLENVK